MSVEVYRYQFQMSVASEDVESSLLLALLATEFLHGETQVRMDAAHYYDAVQRTCVIDAATTVGMNLNKLFTGFLRREFGPDSFQVERMDKLPAAIGSPNPAA